MALLGRVWSGGLIWRLLSFHCVVPCFNEAAVIETFYSAVDDVLGPITFDYEICYVDDGSTDRTWDINGGLSLSDRRVRYAALSRNFGREAAILVGLRMSRGWAAVLMDVEVLDSVGDFRLLSRQAVDTVLSLPETISCPAGRPGATR
ncbi:glycosyltransferase [Streptomyces anulatus]|uniref:glycosyltransferase n=1 Tax=Streptomyces anulatus TaxID=1892 RepID=UPI00381CB65A